MCTIIISNEKKLKSVLSPSSTEAVESTERAGQKTKETPSSVIPAVLMPDEEEGDENKELEKSKEEQNKDNTEQISHEGTAEERSDERTGEEAKDRTGDGQSPRQRHPAEFSSPSPDIHPAPRWPAPTLPPRKKRRDDEAEMDEWVVVKRTASMEEEHEMTNFPTVQRDAGLSDTLGSVPPVTQQPNPIKDRESGCGCLPKSSGCVEAAKWEVGGDDDPFKPPSFLPFSIFVCLFCNAFNCCLGLLALFFSVQSESDYRRGSADEARKKGKVALRLAFAGLTLGFLVVLLLIILFSTGLVNEWIRSHYYRYDARLNGFEYNYLANPGR